MNNENEKRISEKLDFFLENKIKVHITKYNREFLNGELIQKKDPAIYILNENIKGIIYIFVSEIFDIEEFKEKEREND